jgi:hypothetical protein
VTDYYPEDVLRYCLFLAMPVTVFGNRPRMSDFKESGCASETFESSLLWNECTRFKG